jgi:protein O-GlcNAc transferase
LTESQNWHRQHAEPLAQLIAPHANDPNPDRRLRIGYISPDFRDHPVGRFMLPLLKSHDHREFEIFCYGDGAAPDEMTAKLQTCADIWRHTAGQTHADLIRQDRIDILVDLAGHTLNNRLLVFAQKPSPVQITYLGYPGTTGLAAMDYRLTDVNADPPGETESFCTEELIRLPRTAWCFSALDENPAIADPPAVRAGHVTFGSFNNLAKLNPPLLQLWAKILQSIPNSRLLLKAKALNSKSVQDRLRESASTAGIPADRLDLCGWLSPVDHLARYSRIDIALDTYPYHGTTTTCEALWMGVPVITLAGSVHLSRVGVSLLSNAGLPELIAQSPEDYVSIATELAGDLPRLADLRRTLRQRMETSPLMDAAQFARDVESAYRAVWRRWCQKRLASPVAGD